MINENIVKVSGIEAIEKRYLDYGMTVITNRALPAIEDGLKPVHRRILWDMWNQKVLSTTPYRKSAAVVGSTMATLHPHGDASIYDALTLLATPWVMRYPLIDFQGNVGSPDGDQAAAMRYTECRLTPLAELNLKTMNKDYSKWKKNFDESVFEPVYIDNMFPSLICNGTSGIAVGMATDFLPHNLNEVGALLNLGIEKRKSDSKIEDKDVLDCIHGPDFPNGGMIINLDDLPNIYKTGRGKVVVRGTYTIDKNQIIFNSVPYKVSKTNLMQQIGEVCDELELNQVKTVRDETTKHGVRFVITCTKAEDIPYVLEVLFAKTKLQSSYTVNQTVLENGVPKVVTIKDMIDSWVDNRIKLEVAQSEHEVERTKRRIEVLEGLIIAAINIDDIISLIRQSTTPSDAKINLMNKYPLTELQTIEILKMTLSRLTKVHEDEIRLELQDNKTHLEELYQYLQLESHLLYDKIIADINKMLQTFGDKRRTKLERVSDEKVNKSAIKKERQVWVVLSHKKNVLTQKQDIELSLSVKKGNNVDITTDSAYLWYITSLGRAISFNISELIDAKQTKITSSFIKHLLKPNEIIIDIFTSHNQNNPIALTCVSVEGKIIRLGINKFQEKVKHNNIIEISKSIPLLFSTTDNGDILSLVSNNGNIIRIKLDTINITKNGVSGVAGMSIPKENLIIDSFLDKDFLYVETNSGFHKHIALSEISTQGRGGKGVKYTNEIDISRTMGLSKEIIDKNVPILGRTAKGVKIKG